MRRAVIGLMGVGALIASAFAGAILFGPAFASAQTTTDPPAAQAPTGAPAPPATGDDQCHFAPKANRGPKADLQAAADAIGIAPADVRAALRDGQTLAQIAQAHNVDPQKVVDALVAAEQAKLAKAVKNGRITQEQADAMGAGLTERATARVNGQPPVGGREPGHPRGPRPGAPHRPPGPKGPRPAADPAKFTA